MVDDTSKKLIYFIFLALVCLAGVGLGFLSFEIIKLIFGG